MFLQEKTEQPNLNYRSETQSEPLYYELHYLQHKLCEYTVISGILSESYPVGDQNLSGTVEKILIRYSVINVYTI